MVCSASLTPTRTYVPHSAVCCERRLPALESSERAKDASSRKMMHVKLCIVAFIEHSLRLVQYDVPENPYQACGRCANVPSCLASALTSLISACTRKLFLAGFRPSYHNQMIIGSTPNDELEVRTMRKEKLHRRMLSGSGVYFKTSQNIFIARNTGFEHELTLSRLQIEPGDVIGYAWHDKKGISRLG